jgi:hypothetical protein
MLSGFTGSSLPNICKQCALRKLFGVQVSECDVFTSLEDFPEPFMLLVFT